MNTNVKEELRNQAATMAMQSLIISSNHVFDNAEALVNKAVEYSDALINALERKNGVVKEQTNSANNLSEPESTSDVVSIVEQDGQKYVRLHAGKYDICIDLHDAPNEMSWDDAKKYAEDKGMRLFTLEEGLLMYCFKDEINAKLKEAGGDELREDDYRWSGAESSRYTARYVLFSDGYAGGNLKNNGYVVRPVAAFKHSA